MAADKQAQAMGQRLHELREARGLTQDQLAAAAAVSPGAVRNWEQGRRMFMFDAAYRLAKSLGISLDELAGRVFEGEMVPPSPRPRGRPRKPLAAVSAIRRTAGQSGESAKEKRPVTKGKSKKKGKEES